MFYRVTNNKLYEWGDNLQFFDSQENIKELKNVSRDEFNSDPIKYILNASNNLVLNPNYQDDKSEKEQQIIGSLTMTALDFIQVLNNAGVSREQRVSYLASNPGLDDQLKYCQNVYCGVVCQLCPITIDTVEITQDMIIQAFKQKNNVL
jgi:hypothetical protein